MFLVLRKGHLSPTPQNRLEVERLIEAAYHKGSRYGLMIKTLFYTGARVGEFIHIKVEDLHLDLTPSQIYLAVANLRGHTPESRSPKTARSQD